MTYYLSLGSNKGDSLKFLKTALSELKKYGHVLRVSSVYKTSPYGPVDQDNFLNIIVKYKCVDDSFKLLERIKDIEFIMGREESYRWGPREIDIDIIDYSGPQINSEQLKIPHIEMDKRKFVLIPLMEVSPDYKNRYGESIQKLLEQCQDKGTVKKLLAENHDARWI